MTYFKGNWSANTAEFHIGFFATDGSTISVSLPGGQAVIVRSDGDAGSNFRLSGDNFTCYYFILADHQHMSWELKSGTAGLCPSSTSFTRYDTDDEDDQDKSDYSAAQTCEQNASERCAVTACYQTYLDTHPSGDFATAAQQKIEAASKECKSTLDDSDGTTFNARDNTETAPNQYDAAKNSSADVVVPPGGAIQFETPEAPGQTCTGGSLWRHNKSVMLLKSKGKQRNLYYYRSAFSGIPNGTLLFNGIRDGDAYRGTARRFSSRCGVRLYSVQGSVENDRKIKLTGYLNAIDPDTCVVRDPYRDDLEFDFLRCVR